ncbi:MAG: cellobiose phosphorylase, partial [Anaerolineae bacterium]
MESFYFDNSHRFVIEGFATRPPFASFLPGIAGPLGIPMWVFYTNRGQAIAGFGIEDRDNPIMEFQPANQAYQITPLTGFRTFIKVLSDGPAMYEPFAPCELAVDSRMAIGMNTLELQTTSSRYGLQTNVVYFTLSDEPFAGLVRQVRITNVGDAPKVLEVLDGLPWIQPYGVDEQGLKFMGRTLEAWKGVFNVESTSQGLSGVPFYRFQASAGDTAEVAAVRAGHFYLAFSEDEGGVTLLPPFVDPDVVFGFDTSLHTPRRFGTHPLSDLQGCRQITTGKTPCALFGKSATLGPGESLTLHAVVGHVGNVAHLHRHQTRMAHAAYLREQRERAEELAQTLTDVIETQTSAPRFDAYCRQTFLDNVLRGGWPLLLGPEEQPFIYHIYSRKHGDLERDYNIFYLAPEMYSQGNGNYRDVAQNRRMDVFFEPRVDDFNLLSFLSLIQADGYNPLIVLGQRFTLAPEYHAGVLDLVERPEPLAAALAQPFTPGSLLRVISD